MNIVDGGFRTLLKFSETLMVRVGDGRESLQ